jgi:hypothetical protein
MALSLCAAAGSSLLFVIRKPGKTLYKPIWQLLSSVLVINATSFYPPVCGAVITGIEPVVSGLTIQRLHRADPTTVYATSVDTQRG